MIRYLHFTHRLFCTAAATNRIYGVPSQMGGKSSEGLYERYSTFSNKDLSTFKMRLMQTDRFDKEGECALPGINIVNTPEECRHCLHILMRNPSAVVAWDTQTIDLDIKNEAPVGKGKIICASFFAGPQFNFGRGPRVFIDNFGENAGLINLFKQYFESEKYLKVWHNYGFDRHLFYNHGINVRGFGGDTMQMARLYDSGKMFGQYSLSSLTNEYREMITRVADVLPKKLEKQIMVNISQNRNNQLLTKELENQIQNLNEYKKHFLSDLKLTKIKMEQIFKRRKLLKTGTEGVSYQYPNTLTLHTNIQYIQKWITYSALDSETTYYLREVLKGLLQKDKLQDKDQFGIKSMWNLYEQYWLPFGEILTDIEREGIRLDIEHMQKIEKEAKYDLLKKQEYFINFLLSFQDGKNIDHFNASSALQLQQLLYAPCVIKRQEKKIQDKNEFYSKQDLELMNNMKASQEQAYEPKSVKAERKEVSLQELVKVFKVQNKFGNKPKKVDMQVMGLGLPYQKTTPLGLPSVDESVLQVLAGQDPQNEKYGTAFDYFNKKGNPEFGKKLCLALNTLIQYRNIETLLKTFIQPLKGYADKDGRIHCSLNINTETGRLSCRKPNIQNQPSLDKDIYKIRKAFVAQKGKKLIVADYGQLELRVLAHLTNCKAMIQAFKEGGDFHSRTAIGMYDYIRKDIEEGKILLEWDKSKGPAPVPLLKDKYANERKKAKTVNFSIAYGKSAHGFANDWNCTLEEANKVINAWFSDRPQVKAWQKQKQKRAETKKLTQTLLGRIRRLDRFFETRGQKSLKGMWMRRAINTPIQGGGADIVIASMIKIAKNERLKQLGWKLLMQIHDELILQGPEESAKQAFELIKHDMQHPFNKELRVALEVDAKIGNNWYECK